jgi:hypothetical protein
MNIDNKKILIGAGVVVVAYLLYIKSEKDKFKKYVKTMEDKRKLREA